jgi:hypothetical protein
MARSFEQSGDMFIIGTGIELIEQKRAQEDNKRLERMLNQSQKLESVGRTRIPLSKSICPDLLPMKILI